MAVELDQSGLHGRRAAWTPMPRRSAARHTSARSPDGSARQLQQPPGLGGQGGQLAAEAGLDPAVSGVTAGRPNPPASSAGVSPRGNSSSASGLPRVSAMIRSRTRASSGPARPVQQPRAWSCQPCYRQLGFPASSAPDCGSRTPARPGRRPVAAPRSERLLRARSSHCSSSIRQISGWPPATSESRLSTASPIRNRSGGGPSARPNAVGAPPAAAPGSGRGDPASGRTADAVRQRPAPSPTAHRPPAPPGIRRARPGSPAAPSCPRPDRRAPPAPGCRQPGPATSRSSTSRSPSPPVSLAHDPAAPLRVWVHLSIVTIGKLLGLVGSRPPARS